jgi:plastocyanin
MKHLFILVFIAFTSPVFATVWNIEVGGESGSTTNPPYYSPQNLTILEGDQIVWTWVGGPFNVTCTGGPQPFASGNLLPGQSFSFTFTVSGIFTFECTLEDHAQTMFGSVFVFPTGTININELDQEQFQIYPNPAIDLITIETNLDYSSIQLINNEGRIVKMWNTPGLKNLDINEFPAGIYFVQITNDRIVSRKRIVKL